MMRQIDHTDAPQPFGAVVRAPAAQPAKPEQIKPGILRDSGGKMSTNLPDPPPKPTAYYDLGAHWAGYW